MNDSSKEILEPKVASTPDLTPESPTQLRDSEKQDARAENTSENQPHPKLSPYGKQAMQGNVETPTPTKDTTSPSDAPHKETFEQETNLQVNKAIESLGQMPESDPKHWATLKDTDTRIKALQNIENTMAGIQGRPSVKVIAEPMKATRYGGYSRKEENIKINRDHIDGNMPHSEMMDTIIHEGRHAYQDYAVKTPNTVADTQVVTAWQENFRDYKSLRMYGEAQYKSQPLEADAWSYSARIIQGLNQQKSTK